MNIYRISWMKPNHVSRDWRLSTLEDVKAMLTLAYQLGCEATSVSVWDVETNAFRLVHIHPHWFRLNQPDIHK